MYKIGQNYYENVQNPSLNVQNQSKTDWFQSKNVQHIIKVLDLPSKSYSQQEIEHAVAHV